MLGGPDARAAVVRHRDRVVHQDPSAPEPIPSPTDVFHLFAQRWRLFMRREPPLGPCGLKHRGTEDRPSFPLDIRRWQLARCRAMQRCCTPTPIPVAVLPPWKTALLTHPATDRKDSRRRAENTPAHTPPVRCSRPHSSRLGMISQGVAAVVRKLTPLRPFLVERRAAPSPASTCAGGAGGRGHPSHRATHGGSFSRARSSSRRLPVLGRVSPQHTHGSVTKIAGGPSAVRLLSSAVGQTRRGQAAQEGRGIVRLRTAACAGHCGATWWFMRSSCPPRPYEQFRPCQLVGCDRTPSSVLCAAAPPALLQGGLEVGSGHGDWIEART